MPKQEGPQGLEPYLSAEHAEHTFFLGAYYNDIIYIYEEKHG